MSHRVRRVTLWLCVVAWAGVIFYFSSLQSSNLPSRIPSEVGHFGVYAILGFLLYLALRVDLDWRRALLWAILIASAYGVSDEFHQRFVPTRTPDVWDWAVDTLGALVGASLAWALLRMTRRRTRTS